MAVDVQTRMLRLVTADGETIGDSDMLQGLWTVEQYLRLTDQSNRLIEFTNGSIEVPPMPTDKHQNILAFLFLALHAFLHPVGARSNSRHYDSYYQRVRTANPIYWSYSIPMTLAGKMLGG